MEQYINCHDFIYIYRGDNSDGQEYTRMESHHHIYGLRDSEPLVFNVFSWLGYLMKLYINDSSSFYINLGNNVALLKK